MDEEQPQDNVAPSEPESVEVPSPAPRTRKAKETQYRLGMGRPTLAGGKGARAITKSLSISKKRGKGSRSMKPVEDAIQEEDEGKPIAPICLAYLMQSLPQNRRIMQVQLFCGVKASLC